MIKHNVHIRKYKNMVEIVSDLFMAYRTGNAVRVIFNKGCKIPMRFNSSIYKLLHKLHNQPCDKDMYYVTYILNDTESNTYRFGQLMQTKELVESGVNGDTSSLQQMCDLAMNYVDNELYEVKCDGALVRNIFFMKDVAVINARNNLTYFAESIKELDKLLFITLAPVKISLLG